MADTPHCPKCPFTKLEPLKLDEETWVDECPGCHGRWYDNCELEHTVKDPTKLKSAMAKGLLRPRPVKTSCPRCEKEMQNAGLGSDFLRVDWCEPHGFWLDAGELRLLDKLLES